MINKEKFHLPPAPNLTPLTIPAAGAFVFYDTVAQLYKQIHLCRDYCAINLTEERFTANIRFAYALKDLKVELFHEFIMLVEDKLGISEKNRTEIQLTNMPEAVIIKPGPFWMRNNLRKNVLTMVIRCAGVYYPNCKDFDKTFKAYEYSVACSKILKLFFEGNTLECEERLTTQSLMNHWGVLYHYRNEKLGELVETQRILRKPVKKETV